MDRPVNPGGINSNTEKKALLEKTVVDPDGTVRRTHLGPDGTIYRTVIYPDGNVKRMKKAPTPESIQAASKEMARLEGRRISEPDKSDRRYEDRKRYASNERTYNKDRSGYASNDRRPDRPQHKPKKGIAFLILFVVVIGVAAAFWFTVGNKYTPGTEVADLNEYYSLTDDSQAIIVVDNELQEQKGLIYNGNAYLDYDDVRRNVNPRIYIDSNENILLYSFPTYTIRIEAGSTSYDDNGNTVELGHEIFTNSEDIYYVSLEFIKKFSDIEGKYYSDPNRIVINASKESFTYATLNKAAEMRELGGTKSPIMVNLEEGSEVAVLERGEPWTKVATSDGLTGYVKDDKLSDTYEKSRTSDFEAPVYTDLCRDHPIHMAWFQATGVAGNEQLSGMLDASKNLNVISPTWFFMQDTEGNVYSIASSDTVNMIHSRGMEVWAAVNDFDAETIIEGPNSFDETYEVLSHTSKRTHLEEGILEQALSFGVDGINVDFENIGSECGPHYIQFIRELSILCRNNGLVLSVDSYVPSQWSLQYHRDEQGEIIDYVVIMTYDQNGPWSDGMGSNSDYPYVNQAIADMTSVMDPSKLIIGIPFYTRIWEEAPMSGTAGNELKCTAYGMADAEAILNQNDAERIWNDECGQYIATYKKDDSTFTTWVEDVESLKLKLDSITSSGLAGWSCWKLGQETPDVWDLLEQY